VTDFAKPGSVLQKSSSVLHQPGPVLKKNLHGLRSENGKNAEKTALM